MGIELAKSQKELKNLDQIDLINSYIQCPLFSFEST